MATTERHDITICLRFRRRLVRNLRVRIVASASAWKQTK